MLSVPDYNLHEWDHLYQRRFISRRVTLHKFSDVRPKFPEIQLPRLSADACLDHSKLKSGGKWKYILKMSEKTKLDIEGDEWKGTTLNSKNLYWLRKAQTAISVWDRCLMSGRKWESETLHEVWKFKQYEKDKKARDTQIQSKSWM